jgi:hypothetical protein
MAGQLQTPSLGESIDFRTGELQNPGLGESIDVRGLSGAIIEQHEHDFGPSELLIAETPNHAMSWQSGIEGWWPFPRHVCTLISAFVPSQWVLLHHLGTGTRPTLKLPLLSAGEEQESSHSGGVSTADSPNLQFFVRVGAGRTRVVQFPEHMTVEDLMLALCERFRIPEADQRSWFSMYRLQFEGHHMPDGATLRECGVQSNSTVLLLHRLRGGVKLTIGLFEGAQLEEWLTATRAELRRHLTGEEDKWAARAAGYCEGVAAARVEQYFNDSTELRPHLNACTWQQFVAGLREAFPCHQRAYQLRARFAQLRPSEMTTEALYAYVTAFTRLVDQAAGTVSAEEMNHFFLAGLPTEARQYLALHHPASVGWQDVLLLTERWLQAQVQAQPRPTAELQPLVQSEPLQKQVDELAKLMSQLRRSLPGPSAGPANYGRGGQRGYQGQRDRPERSRQDLVCYNCEKTGHFARDCRSAPRGPAPAAGKGKGKGKGKGRGSWHSNAATTGTTGPKAMDTDALYVDGDDEPDTYDFRSLNECGPEGNFGAH